MLLFVVRGATSFQDLRTAEGHICETFKDAAVRSGLLVDDSEHDAMLTEGALCASPSRLREVSGMLLAHCEPKEPWALWERHKESLTLPIRNVRYEAHEGSSMPTTIYVTPHS